MSSTGRWREGVPWRTLAIVTLLCAALLVLQLFGSQTEMGVYWFVQLPIELCALVLSVRAIAARPSIRAAAPLATFIAAVVLSANVPWQRAYLRVVWMLHHREYIAVVEGLRSGGWTLNGATGVMDAAGKPVSAFNTTLIKQDTYPVQNTYFNMEQAGDRYMRPIGFMCTAADDAAVRRAWDAPDTLTLLEPHWYMVTAAEWR